MAGISIWQLMIILVIVMLIFGTKKLKNIGSDLGGAIKGFKNSMATEESKAKAAEEKKTISEKKEADASSQKAESKENQKI